MQALTDALLLVFLTLGSAWFAVDLTRKLRAPARLPAPVPAPAQGAAPASADDPVRPRSQSPALITPVSVPPVAPASPPASPAPEPIRPAERGPAAEGIPPDHLAVIAATIHHLFRGRARIASLVAAGPAHSAIDWAREGRRDIFSSHRLR